jgi:aspartate aminotransferase
VLFDGSTFHAPARFYPTTVVVYSFGKALFIQGQRIGYVAVSPRLQGADEFVGVLERLCRVMGFCTPTTLMQSAVRRLLDQPLDFTSIAARRRIMLDALEGAPYHCLPSQASFFLYPSTPGGGDFEFVERLAARGLLALPAPMFHHSGHFRLSLTAADADVERAADILRELGGEYAS